MKKIILGIAIVSLCAYGLGAATFGDEEPVRTAGAIKPTIESGELDLCVQNTSSNYTTYDKTLYIPEDCPLKVYTSRYTEFKSVLKGDGSLSLYCGGERTYIGTSNGADYPDWSVYRGDVHIYPWTEVEKNAGFYGVILNHGGKRFNPEDIEGSLKTTNSQLIKNRMYIHDGATLATPTGTRGVRIGELNTDAGSRIFGAIKKTTSSTVSGSYFVIGNTGTDAVLAGVIRSVDDASTPLGIIKEGEGTYRITGNDNVISGAVRVLKGTVLINNDADRAEADHLQGAIGALSGGAPGVFVFEGATAGGTGSVASVIDVYGNLMPGDGGVGTLTLADYVSGSAVDLRLRPTSKLYFDVSSATEYDRINLTGDVNLYNICQDFQQSDKTPILYLEPTDNDAINAGDEFTLITAAGHSALVGTEWTFRIQYPKRYTWQVSEIQDESGYRLVAKVTSLEYSGQGDVDVADENGSGDISDEDEDDGFDEKTDPTPLRTYADAVDSKIGVAVSTWRINGFDNDNNAEIKEIYTQFNAIVAENEMKFDATEPSRGSFSYNDGDRIVNLALRHGMYVRGHALAWHKQMPSWLSSDGGVKNNNNYSREELLKILENHIKNVVGHYKGKVKEWDVVNECLSDDQTAIRTNPDAYDLRPSVWMSGIGEDYIDSAFVYAHRADPDALLILNEYDAEFQGVAKTEALFNLAKRLKRSGIPIHGVGFQCHLDAGNVDAAKLNVMVDRYAEIGLSCIITELDLGISSKTQENLELQAKDFGRLARVVAKNPNCRGMIVWGFSDDQSWRSSNPLLYDNAHAKKPAYYAVHAAFRRAAGPLGVNDITFEGEASIVSVNYYTLDGIQVINPIKGLYLKVCLLDDGSYKSEIILK